MKKLIIALMLMSGCKSCTEYERVEKIQNNKIDVQARLKRVVYFKDCNTGLCYASWWFNTYAETITNVPCTEDVEKRLIK